MQLDFNLLNLMQQGNGLIFVGGVVALGGVVVFTQLVSGFIQFFSRKKSATARRVRFAPTRKTIAFLTALVLVFMGSTLIFGGMTVKTYTTFTRADHVGMVECLSWNRSDQTMVVRWTPIRNGRIDPPQTVSLVGDQWEINANILKWTPRASLLGLHTGYRLNQIKGIYNRAEDENEKPHRAYALSTGTDLLWRTLVRYGEKLPFVDAVYGNAVSRFSKPGDRFDVFVTTSGLIVRHRQSDR